MTVSDYYWATSFGLGTLCLAIALYYFLSDSRIAEQRWYKLLFALAALLIAGGLYFDIGGEKKRAQDQQRFDKARRLFVECRERLPELACISYLREVGYGYEVSNRSEELRRR